MINTSNESLSVTKTFGEWFYKYSLMWGSLSSLIIFLLVYGGIRSSAIFGLKDFVIYVMAIAIFPQLTKSKQALVSIYLFACFLWYIYINYTILNPSYNAAINNIRQILSPLVLLFFYCQVILNTRESVSTLKILCVFILGIFGFGLLEQITGLWSLLNLSIYFELKGIPTDEKGLSYMFYEPLFGGRERMTSTFLDPISLGHLFASAGILLYYIPNKTKLYKLTYYVCLCGMFLALSKGAIFQFFIAVVLLNEKINLFLRSLLVVVPFVFIQVIDSEGISIHIMSFLNSIDTISPFGYGLGNAGNYAAMFATNTVVIEKLQIGDTYIGSLLGQIGIIGTLLWIVIGVRIIWNSSIDKKHVEVPMIIFLSIFAVSILSENTMNVTSFLLPALMIGLSSNLSKNGIFG